MSTRSAYVARSRIVTNISIVRIEAFVQMVSRTHNVPLTEKELKRYTWTNAKGEETTRDQGMVLLENKARIEFLNRIDSDDDLQKTMDSLKDYEHIDWTVKIIDPTFMCLASNEKLF